MIEQTFRNLVADAPEFGRLLRQVVPEFHVDMIRLYDGCHLLPSACVALSLSGVVPDGRHAPGVAALFTRTVAQDLFEAPQRERSRAVIRTASARFDQCESDQLRGR